MSFFSRENSPVITMSITKHVCFSITVEVSPLGITWQFEVMNVVEIFISPIYLVAPSLVDQVNIGHTIHIEVFNWVSTFTFCEFEHVQDGVMITAFIVAQKVWVTISIDVGPTCSMLLITPTSLKSTKVLEGAVTPRQLSPVITIMSITNQISFTIVVDINPVYCSPALSLSTPVCYILIIAF